MKNYFKKIIKNPALYNFFASIYEKFFLSRPKKSYSQTGEDLILDFFFERKKSGFFVDIGAYHPKYLSNTYLFYKKGWRGVNIEPNIERFKRFKNNRPNCINLNIGVGEKEGIMDFYVFDSETLSTFSKESADNNVKLGHKLMRIEKVKIKPLSKIFEENLSDDKIDFMTIDTEGYDMEVLRSNDWKKYRPNFVVLETAEYTREVFSPKLNDTFDSHMASINYKKVADTYVNTIYKDINNN